MDLMITSSAEMKKIKSLDDDKLWAGFDWEETDKILSGEIKPRTLITSYPFPAIRYPQRGPLIAQELVSVVPNSCYVRRGIRSKLHEVIAKAKKRHFTSLILTHTNPRGHDELIIISLLNGASAVFRVIDFIPRAEIPNCANPLSRRIYPELHMKSFDSQASVGTARMIQALFPKVPSSGGRPIAWFQKQNNHIFFRSHRFCYEEPLSGESSSVRRQPQECGPRFALKLRAVERVSFDTGKFKLLCVVRLILFDE
ncbi:hypothetical protein ARALYDRAFT_901791 [Arabidopsis lyrata subsp. lyrata]|uniref:Brix domain-containing protein n=1 Tax=Arabidopsis lyrata subsp. lyrata TaxID=81972 RepID=D7LJK4_ARALL|nr:hypothetical protein ARALYDRAFT_901791 [Arabidopsis lyrata subsp. lyrata]